VDVVARLDRRSPETIRIAGEIDMSNADSLGEALAGAIRDAVNGHLRVDLSELTFIDSSGIHMLVKAAKAHPGLRLTLVSPTPTVERVLEICGIPRDGDGYVIGPLEGATPSESD
jgi:anti-anti-sigma factor